MFFASGRLFAGVRLHCPRPQWVRLSLIAHDPLPILPSGLARQHENQQLVHNGSNFVTGRRFYADGAVSRPKAHTGRTTRKVRAQKSAAPKTATENASTTKPKTKKATSPKKVTAKSKSKPKSKPKSISKILTDEEKKKKAERIANERLKKLRMIALLKPPKELPQTAWTVFTAERIYKALKGSTASTASFTDTLKQSSIAYKELSPEEIEHYNHVANQNKEKNIAAYDTWIASYSPKEIEAANTARRALSRRRGIKRGHKFPPLKDGRRIRKPGGPFPFFLKDRFATGDYKGIMVSEATKLVAREWKALPEHEKTLYKEKSDKQRETYQQERAKVYGD